MQSTHDAKSYRTMVDEKGWSPKSAVWEITLACNLRCGHCGSRAGKPRGDELTTSEALSVARQLGAMGCKLVSLSGGEPTTREDWDQIARELVASGVMVNMVSNGVYDDPEAIAQRAIDAGMVNIGISIDGTKDVHEQIRGRNTFARTCRAVEVMAKRGLHPAVMTTVSKSNLPILSDVRKLAIDLGASMWRLQMAKPMGVMDEHRDDVLAPEQFLQLVPLLAHLKKKGEIQLRVGDSIGYYGPHETLLRSATRKGRKEMWRGCRAGMEVLGIEANGNVKGCLSLQAKIHDADPFVDGNLRQQTLEEIWYRPGAFAYNREFALDSLTGKCARCAYKSTCRGGARCVSSAVMGTLTEDPYCYTALAAERSTASWAGHLGAAAAAAMLLAAAPGCSMATDYGVEYGVGDWQQPDIVDTDQAEDPQQPEYGIDLGGDQETDEFSQTDYGLEYGIDVIGDQTDYGLPGDAISDQTDYGLPGDAIDGQTDYGLPGDAIDGQTDYGLPTDASD